jgi:dTDP-4-dehydrorhamnose reductase
VLAGGDGSGPVLRAADGWGPVLLTGGGGRLGSALRALLPGLRAPSRRELDVTDAAGVWRWLVAERPRVVVHAAAYTDVAAAEREREACWRVNVEGTRHVADACASVGATLVHVSTDYVFWGDADPARAARGGYREDDPTGPTRNYYALSKLAAEAEARRAPRHLVVRTSFRASAWPYPVAFSDVHTSQTYVDEIAPELAEVVRLAARIVDEGVHVLHVAGPPTTAFALARRRAPAVREGRKAAAGVELPDDVTLDSSRWHDLRARLGATG